MTSKAQIKARENFVKNYAQKKKGSKSTKTNRKKDKYDKLYEADRREWNSLMEETKFGRLAKLAKKKAGNCHFMPFFHGHFNRELLI